MDKNLIALLLTAISGYAADVNLQISPSPTQGVTNYTVYAKTAGATIAIQTGTNLTTTLISPQPGSYVLYATAWKDGIESGPSPTLNVEVALPPAGLKTVIIQGAPFINATNWQDVGFFKIKIP